MSPTLRKNGLDVTDQENVPAPKSLRRSLSGNRSFCPMRGDCLASHPNNNTRRGLELPSLDTLETSALLTKYLVYVLVPGRGNEQQRVVVTKNDVPYVATC